MKRITIITGEYPPMQGGVGDYTRQLAQAVVAQGDYEVHVVTKYLPQRPNLERAGNITVHRLISHWGWRTRSNVESINRVYPPDVVNIQYQAAAYQMHPAINLLPAMLARRVPTWVTFHDLKVPYLFPKAGPLRWKAIVNMAKSATGCIVTNTEDFDTLRQEGVTRLHLIPIGSNIAPAAIPDFDRQAWLASHNIPPDELLVGYFGFWNESKGGESLLRAIAELRAQGRNVGLLHIGGQTGDSDPTNQTYAARLSALAQELGIQVHIHATGFLEDTAVSKAFAACSCVALPYRDGASFRRGTLMAALAHGCAVITTRPRVSTPEMIHEENMLLVPTDSPSSLAEAIARTLDNPTLRRKLQAGARALSSQFQWGHIAAQMLHAMKLAAD